MKQSQLFAPTLRDIPADAEAISHQLLLRAGCIRQVAAGIYSLLPLGRRALQRVEAVIREELEAAGANEVLLPALQPAELWRQSGRYDVYGEELIRLTDRGGREFALGPTHEEVVTSLIAQEVSSYRKLPLTVYQIQTKFRDERRPRFGLLRVREFLMKDAYSFDADWEGLSRSYETMYEAYHRIFNRLGLRFRAVLADAGAIGGEGGTHEFMALADIGEDTIIACTACEYAANLEKAEAAPLASAITAAHQEEGERMLQKFATPSIRTIQQLEEQLGIKPSHVLKTLLYLADGEPVAVLIRGDHEANETKIMNALGAASLEMADAETVRKVTGAPTGFAGPVGLDVRTIIDREAAAMPSAVAGANEADHHYRNVVPGRDFRLDEVADLRNVRAGEACPHCGRELAAHRGIEIGHVFKLGTKYSSAMQASFADAEGKDQPFIMGCYGIGVTRLLSAMIEQHHDERGIIWPVEAAPFGVHLLPVSMKDDGQREIAMQLYAQLRAAGIEPLLDDRDERLGVKLKDADLIGIPVRIVIGKEAAEGQVEFKPRVRTDTDLLPVDEAIIQAMAYLGK
ncbi:proline--tRNA ligase [Paenibacillus methanolicus]|uniref:Proline--tRNA ligase n=1 Tax=Paenibacillus methanolicus TaxID=582686 RepID=A0A5S5CIM1_9BACL|nr:proline--tRNA ligase [Paenibacillus methanolicus]TYP79600.1 prolyl-tRNA synthetase [Paenibacillus methanolicus]